MRPYPAQPIIMFGKQYLWLHYSEVDDLCQWVLSSREANRRGTKLSTCGKMDITMSLKPEMRGERRGGNHEEASNYNEGEKEVGVCRTVRVR